MKIVILNKPYDVLSQFRKDEAHMTVSDFVDDPTLRLAGRLDMDSEGLVFFNRSWWSESVHYQPCK